LFLPAFGAKCKYKNGGNRKENKIKYQNLLQGRKNIRTFAPNFAKSNTLMI